MTEILNTEILHEGVFSARDSVKIDREAGVLYGVKIIGCESRNGRHYPNETLRHAIPLYENSKVNLDHPDGDPRKSRSYHARFGVIRNVHLRENEGLYADFWFNPKHLIAEQLLWDAEHAPDNVGFSHNVEAVVKRQAIGNRRQQNDGITTALVEKIVAVRSVDLVADPASTHGLFESLACTGGPCAGGSGVGSSGASSDVTLEQVERLIEDRLQRFQRDVPPQSREQTVGEGMFDSKAFAASIKGGRH